MAHGFSLDPYEFDVFDERGNGSEGVLHRWLIDDDGGHHFSEGNISLVGTMT